MGWCGVWRTWSGEACSTRDTISHGSCLSSGEEEKKEEEAEGGGDSRRDGCSGREWESLVSTSRS